MSAAMEHYHKQYYRENKHLLDKYSIDYYKTHKKEIRNKRLERNPMCCCGSRKEAHNKTESVTFRNDTKLVLKGMCKTHYLFKGTLIAIANQWRNEGRTLKSALRHIVSSVCRRICRQRSSQLSIKKLKSVRPHKL